jgi:hypothetical protein
MDFAFVAFKAALVSEAFAIARCMVANVRTNVFVLMSPEGCKYKSPLKYGEANYFSAGLVENNCCSGQAGKVHFRGVFSSSRVDSPT